MCLQYKSFENTVGKEEIAQTSNFSSSHIVFYPFVEISAIFIKLEIVVCELFQFGPVQNLSFGKGLIDMILTLTHCRIHCWVSATLS